MTVGFYLNVEVVLKKIVEEEISCMTFSNIDESFQDMQAVDYGAFENNFHHGIIALLLMCDYLETSINSVIRSTYKVERHTDHNGPAGDKEWSIWKKPEETIKALLKKGYKEKTKVMVGDGVLSKTPSEEDRRLWHRVTDIVSLRDELVHYKANYMQEGLCPNPHTWYLDGQLTPIDEKKTVSPNHMNLGRVFTKNSMQGMWNDITSLLKIILRLSNCSIREDTTLIDADGREGYGSYIVKNRNDFSIDSML